MDWKKLGMKLLFPPLWVVLLLVVVCTAGLVLIFVKGWEESPAACVFYPVAFYALTTVCMRCWKFLPGKYHNARQRVYANAYANRYLTDRVFKTRVNLYRSLAINLLYVLVNALSAIIYHTSWFAIFSVYYGVMAMMRFLLLRYIGKQGIGTNRLGELKRARLCGCILLTVNLSLTGAVLMMVYFQRGFAYRGFLIYVMALYTFYITTAAIIDIVKYRKHKSPILAASTAIKLAAALVSMLSLETAMFSQFGADTTLAFQQTMIMATGGGISVIVIAISALIIWGTTKEMKKIRSHYAQ